MTAKSKKNEISADEWITQKEAAELRQTTLNVINNWAARGHVRTTEIFGKKLVHREDVLAYQPAKGGRPKKEE